MLCSRFVFYVQVTGHQVVPVSVVLWVQSVNLVGCLDYFSGHQAWLSTAEAIHAIREAAVSVVGTYVVIFMATVWGGTTGAVPGDQTWIPVHVVGAFPLWRGGARARPWGG